MKRSAWCVLGGIAIGGGLLLWAGAPSDAQPPAGQAQAPTEQERRARIVARVGKVTITVGDLEDAIAAQSPFLRARFRDRQALREHLEHTIRFELLAAEAERRGYGRDPTVERSVAQSAVQWFLRREFDERIRPETIPDEDVRAHYESHRDEFHRPEMVRASHVLLATRQEALEVIRQAREGDARAFRELARQRSLDAETKLRGGDLRYFDRQGRSTVPSERPVDPAIVEAAFALRELGDVVAEPVPVGPHWSVIKLTGRRPAETRTLEQAAPDIRLRLWRERRQRAIDDLVASLRQRVAPVVYEERMRAIRLDPTPSPEERRGLGHTHGEHGEPAAGSESSAMSPTSAPLGGGGTN
ncbi:MAG: peptidylprolyl isomerase [Myxococcota bacterium]|nr:peptidylprolyl isomerase [Myxococcota bacterium]MDW8360828.1 peptidylprolyl isomerase [Myxococcales bacterium]